MFALTGVSAEETLPQASPPALVEARADANTLSVMTYNIEGLPTPVRFGRSDAARRIAEQLAAMRADGAQPHVVVLQEAFGSAQRSIGRKAGYRYVAFGPDRDLVNHEPESDADRAFARRGNFMKGEGIGKWAGSGLAILSDYPIVSVARTAFPTFACAGYDCLANKGVMLAMVQVPGAAQPVAVVATHMNSRQASGVSADRFTYAWMRQSETIGSFLKANLAAGTPYVLAGDTNIGKSVERRAAFEAMLASLPRATDAGVVRTALGTCLGADSGCALGQAVEVKKAFRRGKDWQAYASGAELAIAPAAIDAPFGHDANGRMLSDHIGYTAFYRLADARPAAGGVVALR
ncbi:endonuclease/exonuclease/phosphatase family protein [Sphingomonas nostoxanthinifaciens]|uniref:endonuclease/exonuclease/phosphatase family protein n=1 Tax=Sphingomonas nostoxanthinifaciens TaxID=2872652 RepID=UPI001CC20E7C|nr:endonuclease/exonuclease/phosphatase family protein [Sphingomonas nostoxanthinifaciens]UAK26225.1 endonuclease/exonuclease/phosphatase family protein [Sphingomonas nostoxanthinifaciens]